jgi:TetR/AcrR family fatty acid metabolism transcriptional regulator
LSDLGDRIAAAIDEAIAQAPVSVPAQMKAAVEGFVLFLSRHPDEARILIVESSGLSPRLEQIRRAIIASHTKGVEESLRRLAPEQSPSVVAIAARCWTGAVYEAVYSWLEAPESARPPAQTVAETVVRFNLQGAGWGGGLP